MDVDFMWSWADDTARGPEVGKDAVCRWNSVKSSRERVTGQCVDQVIKGPVGRHTVPRPGSKRTKLLFQLHWWGGDEDAPPGLREWPCCEGCKIKKKVKLLKIMVFSALCPLALERERDTSGQRETDQSWAGLLGYWHSWPISFFIILLERGRTYAGGEEWVPMCSI